MRRQAVLSGVNWKTPAIMSSAALSRGDMLTIIGDTKPLRLQRPLRGRGRRRERRP